MARKKTENLDDWNRSLGYSDKALKALESGTYDQLTGRKSHSMRSEDQARIANPMPIPALAGLKSVDNEWTSRLSNAAQYQRNLAADANNYKFNNATRKANTLDADDMKYLQKFFDEYGDSARTKKALYESKKTQGWEQKYGKSYDEIYRDFIADQGNVNLEKGFANPIKSEIESVAGIIPQLGAAGASFVGNMIDPDSKFAKAAEELRHRNEVIRKQKRTGVKAAGASKVENVNKALGNPESLQGAFDTAKNAVSTGIETAHGLGDRMLPTMLAKASKVPFLDAIASGLSDYNTQMEEVRNRPGMDGRQQAKTAGAHAAIEGLGTAITMNLLDKIPGASGALGRAINIGKGAGNAGLENYISELVEQRLDNVVSKDLSKEELTKGMYMLNGMTPDQAEKQVADDLRKQRGAAFGTGALFGGTIKGMGEITDAIRKIPMLKGMTPEAVDTSNVDTSDIDNVIDDATKQAETAQANIQNLSDQIPEAENTTRVELPEKTKAVKPEIKPLEGAELEEAQKELASLDNRINALKNNIELYSRQKNNKGNTTKAAKEKIKETEAEIKKLEDNRVDVNRRINGETKPVIEQLKNAAAVKDFKKSLNKIAKMSPENKGLAQDAKAALDEYIETGDMDAFSRLSGDLSKINEYSRNIPEYMEDWGNSENGIWDSFHRGNLAGALNEAKEIHAKNAADATIVQEPRIDDDYNTVTESVDLSSMDIPHQLAHRLASASERFDYYDYMDDIDGVDGFIEKMADDISMGRDLTGYIDSLYENIDETDDPALRAEIQSLIDDLSNIQEGKTITRAPETPIESEGPAPESDIPPSSNVPPTPDLEEGQNLSRRFHTLMNSDLIKSSVERMRMIESAKDSKVFDKGIESRQAAQQAAIEEYLADEQAAINDLASRQWDSGKDVDMSMLILKDALDSNDQAWVNMTLLKQATEVKGAARELRALRDYSYGSTREGTLAKAADFLVDKAEEVLNSKKKNSQLTSMAEKIAKGDMTALQKLGMDEANIQSIVDAVNNGASANEIKTMLAIYEAVGKTGISKEAMSQLNELYKQMENTGATSKARADIMEDVFKVLANDIGGKRTAREMWDAWRYLAMLGNPKTHLRNMVGNTTHRMVTEVKDNVAAVMEEALDKANRAAGGEGIERTKALLGAKDKGLIELSAKDADDVAYAALNDVGNKYNVKDEIDRARNAFNNKALSKIDELNSKALDLEDYSALKKKYSRSLARYLKANGADESIFSATDDASKQLLQKARDYAVDQAKQATFHEYSKMAELLSRMSTDLRNDNKLSHKLGGAVLEGLLPFKKTPINILKQGIKYSPYSFAKAVTKMVDAVKTGNSSASDAIEDLASGFTGSMIMGLGAFLAHQGLLTGAKNPNYNVDEAETEQGAQNYALKIGDTSYTLDWLAPLSLPLFVGAELMNLMEDQDDEGDVVDKVIGAISTIAEPVTEMSMLQGIQNILNELSYSRENLIATFGANTALGYLSQAIPTMAGQFARSIDDTRRSTYTDEPAGFRRQFDKTLTKDFNKIPFLSMSNEAYIDASGKTQQNEGFFTSMLGNNMGTRLMDQMLSPGYYKEGNVTDVDRELNRLYEATGKDVYKNVANGEIGGSGEKLNKEQFTKYQQLYGGNNDALYNALINSEEYNALDDTQRVQMISDIKSFSKLIADHDIGNKALTKSEQKLYDIYKTGKTDGVIKYFKDKAKATSLGLTYDKYIKQEEENPGGAEGYINDVEQAREYGFLKKDGTLNMQQYYNGLDYAGSDPESLKAYAAYKAQGFDNNDQRIGYLIDDPTFNDEQKGRIIGGLDPDKFKKNPKAMYDMGGYKGLWNYYLLKFLADTDGNGRVSKAESDALLNSNNPYVTSLPDDQYYFLSGALYK